MKILVVSATENEIYALKNTIEAKNSTACGLTKDGTDDFTVDFLVTGIGGVLTSYSLMRKISEKNYDLVINVGIAGSFNPDIEIGDVLFVQSDQFADLGIEDKKNFYTLFEKGFMEKNQFPFKDGKLENPYDFDLDLKKASAITVNTTHGCEKSIDLFKNKFKADLETMEGAAFFYVCLQEGIKFMQIRSVSNYVQERDSSKWDIPKAINKLNEQLNLILDDLEQKSTDWQSF